MDQAAVMQLAQMLQAQGGQQPPVAMPPQQGGLSEMMRQNFAGRGPGPIMENSHAMPPQAGQRPNDPLAPAYQGAADAMVQYGAGAAAPAAGAGLAALMKAAPRLSGIGLGAAGAMIPNQAGDADAAKGAAPDPNSPVVQLQKTLQAAGLYNGPIDGVMGEATKAAAAQYQKAEAAKQAQGLELTRAQGEMEKAKAAAAETERLRMTAEQEAARKQQGDARMQDVQKNVPLLSQVLRDWSGPAGLAVGGLAGLLGRGKVVGASNRASADAATRADGIMTAPARDIPDRVGRVNQFWGEGQPRPMMGGAPQAPFVAAPGNSPPFAANPAAPPATALYQPNRLRNAATDVAIPAAGMGEAVISDQVLGSRARDELKAAQEALSADPSEANIQRQQKAQDAVAAATGISNLGRGMAGGYVAGMPKMQRSPSRPDVAGAEAERIRLDQFLSRGGGVPKAAAPQPVVPKKHPDYPDRDIKGQFIGQP